MSKTSSNDLTSKQRHFCRLVGGGTMSNAEAYRQAYDVRGSKKTSMEAASRLMADSKISAMVESIYVKKEQVLLVRSVDHRQLILDRLEVAVDDNSFGDGRLRALSLLADVTGMKKSGIDVSTRDTRSSETILEELRAKLTSLTELGLIDGVIDHGDDMDSDAIIDSAAGSDPIRH